MEAPAPFYVYVHAKPDGTPFYVGKGRLRRARYLGERNAWHRAIVAKYNASNIKITLIACATEEEAFQVERATIARLRADGVQLCNFTCGGEGGSDPIPETRAKISEAAKRRGISVSTRLAVSLAKKGVPLSEEHRAKVRDAMRASWQRRTLSAKQRANISAAAKRRGIAPATMAAGWNANRGVTRPHTEERKARISAAQRARFSGKGGTNG